MSLRLWSIKLINSYHIPDNEIYDFCHNWLPDLRDNKPINRIYDAYTAIPIIILVYLIFASSDWVILEKYLILLFIVNVFRIFFYSVTVLPDANGKCNEIRSTGYKFIDHTFFGACRDLIFSGHVANSYLAWKFLFSYYGFSKSTGLLHQMGLVTTMLCLRRHYSIDIITAYTVTYLIFDKKDNIMNFLGVEK